MSKVLFLDVFNVNLNPFKRMNIVHGSQADGCHSSKGTYSVEDLVMTVIVAFISSLAVYGIISSLYLFGVVIGFICLFWLGFSFAQMPARVPGDLIMSLATLFGFYKGVQSEFGADPLIALVITGVGAVPLLWGFFDGMKRLNETERSKLTSEMDDSVGIIFLSVVGFLFEYVLGIIPYLGLPLGLVCALIVGYVLGSVQLPSWGKFVAASISLAGLALGLKVQLSELSFWTVGMIVGTLASAVALCFGMYRANCHVHEREATARGERRAYTGDLSGDSDE